MSGPASRAQPQGGGEIRAAGAVLYTRRRGGIVVAVIHRPRHDDWALPKGKLEPGEHVLAAAVREVTEETGIRPVLGQPLGAQRYLVKGRPKRVDYWAAQVAEPPHGLFVPGDEVDKLDWLTVPEATTRLSYRGDVQLLSKLADVAAVDTVPCILLRHASAGHKSEWPGDDLLRPLDDGGMVDAQALAGLLACYAPARVISSAAERCLGTVRPYAERIGAAIEAEPAFTVRPAGHGDRTEAARRRMAELLAHPPSMVICGHRENIPVLFRQACSVLGAPAPDGTRLDSTGLDSTGQAGEPPHADRDLPKGGFWVLHVGGRRIAAVERHGLHPVRPA